MSLKGKPNPPAPSPMLKNAANAPVIYFDGVPAIGAFSGNVELELAVRLIMPQRDGVSTTTDMGCVAHLRCSASAAIQLRDSLNRALEMLDNQAKSMRNGGHMIDGDEESPLVKN
jgi:hypothetical protein